MILLNIFFNIFINDGEILKKNIFLRVTTLLNLSFLLSVSAYGNDFCWRDSYGRGAGTIPKLQSCPEGMITKPLFCQQEGKYDRERGHAGTKKKRMERCEKKHGKGNCEPCGALAFQKCKPGFSHHKGDICRTCKPNPPDCKALNLGSKTGASGISCSRPKECPSGSELRGGLCYTKCKSGYEGVGPVCWGKPPSGWVKCGMGAGKTKANCVEVTADQFLSVGEMAFSLATLGGGSAMAKSSEIETLRKMAEQYDAIKDTKRVKDAKAAAEAAGNLRDGFNIAKDINEAETGDDVVGVGIDMMALVDPTGILGVVSAYRHPKCSKVAESPWVTVSNGSVPSNAFMGGVSSQGRPIAVCRSPYQGGIHIGKVVANKCNFGWGGKEIVQNNFEVLKQDSQFIWSNNKDAYGAIIGGRGTIEPFLKVCRADYESGKHPGKVVAGKCNFGWGGKEIVSDTYQVLIAIKF